MTTDPDIDDLTYLVTHVFCPLRLPSEDDHSIPNDLALSEAVFSSASAYAEHVCDARKPEWNRILKMLHNLSITMQVESQLGSMDVGDVNVYLIRAQNAAVVFRKKENHVLFEAFEVSPTTEAVMGARGKLVCSYPGPAIKIPDDVFEDDAFLSELVNFLVHMNDNRITDALPVTHKARSQVEETRDTVDPRYVTELLTGILRGIGHPADIVRISKRIGDDVVYTNALRPWRRSSLWLVIRVALQTTLEQPEALGRQTYKAFMIFFMHELAQKAIEGDMSSELLHFMSTKISRRLMKLASSAPDWLSCTVLKTCTGIREILETRWKLLSLLKSRGYIRDALMNQGTERPRGLFAPKHRPRGTLDDFLSSDGEFFEDAYLAEPHVTLYDVEQAVGQGIDDWVASILDAGDAEVDEACVQLETLAEKYSSEARKAYKNNPEDLSVMFLTTIELWVALDKIVVEKIPMLQDYSPEIPLAILETLLLRKPENLDRLRRAYEYIRDRHRDSQARGGWSVFSNPVNDNNFAVRYYKTSDRLKTLNSRIENDARRAREEKLEELRRKNEEHAELGRQIAAQDHSFYAAAALPGGVTTTFHLLVDLCSSSQPEQPYILLDNYFALLPYHEKHPRSRVTLASDTKPFIISHYKIHPSLTREYLKSTSHTSNEVIDLSLHEFTAFGHLRSGSCLQWLNILREIRARTLTFRRNEVHLLLAQAAGQVGPLSEEGEWAWHRELSDPFFCDAMLGELESLVLGVEANWLEGLTMSMVSFLISRLLTSDQSSAVKTKAHELLRKVREKTFSWVQELSVKVQDVEDEDIRGRLRDIAAICRGTFDVDPEHMREQLSSPRDVEILVSCAIFIHDSTPAVLTGIPKESRLLHERDRRLSMALEEILTDRIWGSNEGINLAVTSVWPAYQPGSQWGQLEHPNSRWFSCQSAVTNVQQSQEVHFNLLDGTLLVEGKPLGKLPREITSHYVYKLIFENRILDVIPGNIPGMEYTTRGQISGWQVHFALKDDELQIMAEKGGRLFELIPQRKLEGDLPTPLVDGHAHWLNISDWTIEVRPLGKRWEHRQENWQIYLAPGSYSMRRGSAMLADIGSQTWTMLSNILSPLERRDNLFIMFSPCQSIQGISALRLVVELPRYGLSFFVDNDGDLQSFNMQDMVYDKNQSTGTMFGLVNQLVLRPKVQVPEELNQRCVLIPDGNVSFKKHGHHIRIEIDTHSPALRRVMYHTYKVNTELGYLGGNVNLTNQLYRAYLHACDKQWMQYRSPDGKDGHRRSVIYTAIGHLPIIHEVGSWCCKTPVLDCIVDSTEGLDVEWSSLAATAQYHGLYFAAESIKKRWERDQMFRENQPTGSIQELPSRELFLPQRASLRAALLYPHEFSDQFSPGKCDTPYPSRDLVCAGNEHRAYSIASTAFGWASMQNTVVDLLGRLESWGEDLHGHIRGFSLSYSEDWLRPDLPKIWLTAYNTCRRSDGRTRFELLFSLAAMAYGSPERQDLVTTLLAFATVPAFRTIDPPLFKSYELSKGYEPSIRVLRNSISSSARGLEDSPEWSISRRYWESDSDWYARRLSEYRRRLESDIDAAAIELLAGWPRESPPSCPSLNRSSYDLSSLASTLDPWFTSWYQNLQLKKHIIRVQEILAQAHVPAPVLQTLTFQASSGLYTDGAPVTAVILGQLFERPAPHRPSIPRLPLGVTHGNELSFGSARLRQLIDGLRDNAQSCFQEKYAEDLRLSEKALCNQPCLAIPESIPHAIEELGRRYIQIRGKYLQYFEVLKQPLNPRSTKEHTVSQAGQWPRITKKTMLQSLASTSLIALPDDWRVCLTTFALLGLELQRCRRLVLHAVKNSKEELFKEMMNEGCDGWEAHLHPDWLLIQAPRTHPTIIQLDGNFLVRRVQAEIAFQMISPKPVQNTAMQLNMGEGKSSVIVPISVSTLANGCQLVRVIVPKALTTQMFQLLVVRLGGLTNRRIYYLPFSRSLKIGPQQISALRELMSECMREGGILVVQPDHVLSLKLMSVEMQVNKVDQVAGELLELQRWLHSHSRDILDESDEILHVRYQLMYTIGCQTHMEGFPERWTTTQQVLSLVKKHASSVRDCFPLGMEFESGPAGSFPHTRILRVNAGQELISRIAEDVMCSRVRSGPRDAIRSFISYKDITPSDLQSVKDHCQDNLCQWRGLLLLRGLLASGILLFVFRERRWRVDYGLDPSRTMLAVPYRAKDSPAPRAEFGHPDIAVVLTCLSYYYGGLTKDQLMNCFEILLKQDDPSLEYESWIHEEVPDDLRRINGVNIKSSEQWEKRLVPLFIRSKAVIDFYLSHVVFPKEAKEFPRKLSCSSWDLAEEKKLVTTGTNDGRYLLPTSITQRDPDHQRATNAKVLAYLLQPENNHYICTARDDGERRTAREFVKLLVSQKPDICVLLDVGAQMLELHNKALATTWLEFKTDAQAAIYFDDNDELMVYARDGATESLVSSPFAQQLDKSRRIVWRKGVRMRKLGHGHSVMFFAPWEVDQAIRLCSEDNTDKIDVADILRWTILETCNDIRHRAPQWAQQGEDHASRYDAWSSYCSDECTSEQVAGVWLQPEAKSLENLYAPAQSGGPVDYRNPQIQQRLSDLGILSVDLSGMDEEQEREVLHEIERERQVERPPKAPSATHHLHHDVETFVQLGLIPQGSTAFLNIFESLVNTSAAFTELNCWTKSVFATADFCSIVQLKPGEKADDFLRAVNWVISSDVVQPPILVVVSPYEVDELLPQIRSSKTVHLHIYTPRVVKSMPPCDDLDLHSIPPVSALWTPPWPLVDQLNVFAGQLYLRDYTTYIELCRFLCLYTRDLEADGDVEIQRADDGFIKPENRPPELNMKGMPYAPTHMGKILDAQQLTEDDFHD
ncbi:hypothetical protein BU15DRAFT_64461 [Melanogaster broomeanus]|nr:hypothetical protein BU15DRAFT_64461 [Melanogaster broomeanus]